MAMSFLSWLIPGSVGPAIAWVVPRRRGATVWGIPLVIDGDESVRACAADVACLAGCPYSACRVGYRRRA